MIDGLNILEAINAHQVVGRDVNPARAEHALTPRPEALPGSLVHAMRDAESEAFEGGEDGEFFGRRFKRF